MKTQGSNSDITTKINKQINKQLHIYIRISPINHLQSQGYNHNFNIAGIHFLETELLVKKFTFSQREICSPLQGSRWQTCSEGSGSEIWPRAFPGGSSRTVGDSTCSFYGTPDCWLMGSNTSSCWILRTETHVLRKWCWTSTNDSMLALGTWIIRYSTDNVKSCNISEIVQRKVQNPRNSWFASSSQN